MKDFEIVFNLANLDYLDKEDICVDYHLWATLDIFINGKSFFENFKDEYYDETGENQEGKMTSSSISKEGIFVPAIPFIESIIEVFFNIEEQKEMVIGDQTGQSSKDIVCRLQGRDVVFAIRQQGCSWEKGIWFDGATLSNTGEIPEIPVTPNNIVKYDSFKTGFLEGIKEFIQDVLIKYPVLRKDMELNQVIKLLKKNFNCIIK